MRSFFIIFSLILVVIVTSVLTLLSMIKRLKISFDLFSIDFKTLQLSDLINLKGFIRIGSKICINNPNGINIKLSSLAYKIFYKGVEVIESSKINENLQKVTIGKNKTTCFITKSDVFINPQSLELLYLAKNNEKFELEYVVYFKIYFLNISKRGKI